MPSPAPCSPKVTSRHESRDRSFSSSHFVILIDGDKDLRERDVLLGVEIIDEVLVREHLIADDDALARENATEIAMPQRLGPERSGCVRLDSSA